MKKKTIFMVYVITMLLIVVGIGFLILRSLGKSSREEGSSGQDKYVLDEANVSPLAEVPGEGKMEEGMLEINMNTVWHFPNGSEPSANAYVANLSTNHYDMAFDITMVDTDEVIYVSSIIPIGSKLEEIVLDKRLSRGEYDAVCTYHLLDSSGEEVETTAVNILIDIME